MVDWLSRSYKTQAAAVDPIDEVYYLEFLWYVLDSHNDSSGMYLEAGRLQLVMSRKLCLKPHAMLMALSCNHHCIEIESGYPFLKK